MKMEDLKRFSSLLDTELIYHINGRVFSSVLDDNHIPNKLVSNSIRGYKIDIYNLSQIFHLNMLQYTDYSEVIETSKNIYKEVLDKTYKDVVINNKLMVSSKILNGIKPHLVDLWFILPDKTLVYKSIEQEISEYIVDTTVFKSLADLFVSNENTTNLLFIVLAGNIQRAIFLYGLYGYVKMIIEAGRLAQALQDAHGYKIEEVDLNYLNKILRFDSEKYTPLVLLVGGEINE